MRGPFVGRPPAVSGAGSIRLGRDHKKRNRPSNGQIQTALGAVRVASSGEEREPDSSFADTHESQ